MGTMRQVAIFGAGGGIGQALVELYADCDETRVFAFSRSQQQSVEKANIHWCNFDYAEEQLLQANLMQIDACFTEVIIASGCLHQGEDIRPEKSLKQLEKSAFMALQMENAWLPISIAQAVLPYIDKSQKSVLACLSARVGSISDNHLGGWYSYRASKACLNMLWRCLAQEKKLSHKHLVLVSLHPGTVATKLSKPFSSNAKRVFSAEQAAFYLKQNIEKTTPRDSGEFIAWDGQTIPY